ncbi:phosphatase PAP2 family protein [Cruoricaptor ignavus]|uniref:phosphatase PAP2 family protein n=1 Tax=Cruoricaptor ignavus TaxID=1118202 RepID=UPI0021A2E8A5|nr:phosphatase PAP2 family protein [Cruoricaptor ignavus]
MAGIISNVFNPLLAVLLFYIYHTVKYYPGQEAQRLLPVLLIVLLPCVFWILWNVRRGRYSNMDVSNRRQRVSLYFFTEAMLLVYQLYLNFSGQSPDIQFFFLMILLVAMHISNYFIKSSMHTAFNIFVAAMFFAEFWQAGLAWLMISLFVAVSRVILKRHTPAEVFSGAAIGLAVSAMYLFVNINANY